MKPDHRKKIIFLGSPAVAAQALKIISEKSYAFARVICVVSQPPKRSSRGGGADYTPVHSCALELGIPVLTPISASDPEFISDLKALEPDVCITAAYGQFLPKEFLEIPKFGTLNIHPSLLPKYRGASPVQRSLENGDKVTGVSILFSELKMDAGPIAAQENFSVNESIRASELLELLFNLGADLMVDVLKKLFTGTLNTQEQNHADVTYAKKIKPEESVLDFNAPAAVLHNKIRAFDMWPGTKACFEIGEEKTEVKIISAQVEDPTRPMDKREISLDAQTIDICCGDKKVLRINQLQLPGRKVISSKEFINGLRGRRFVLV